MHYSTWTLKEEDEDDEEEKKTMPVSTGAAMVCLCHHSICGAELILHPGPKINYWVDDNNSVDEAVIITSADDIIIIDDEIKKDRKPKEKEDNTPRMTFMLPI